MKKIPVLSGQSLFDISIQYTGDVINTYALALANGKSVTDKFTVGELIVIPDGLTTATKEVKYLSSLGILPATAITTEQKVFIPELGIGTMTIGTTFIVR